MSAFSDYTFLSCDGKTDIHVRRCTPAGEIAGIVQIAHGIAEHVERYDAFAAFLADNGYLVVANDHLGHGKSVKSEEDLGFFAEIGGWNLVVGDMHRLYETTHAEHPELPYFLFGHSMGSFLTRTYLIKHPDGLAGAIISGTGQQIPPVVASGRMLGRQALSRGPKYKSARLNQMAFGSYNNRIKDRRSAYDWLTRDPAVVQQYIDDPLCGFIPSVSLFVDMMEGIEFIGSVANCKAMNKSLPVFFVSGDMDPVGEYGKGVLRAYDIFLSAGMNDVTLKLYHDCRHELLNELNRDLVMQDILGWLRCKNPAAALSR